MTSKNEPPKGSDYQSLIDEGIDELNAESNFNQTGFRQEKKEIKPASKSRKSLMLTLSALLLLNLAVFLYLRAEAPTTRTQAQADAELYQKLEDEEIDVEKVLRYVRDPKDALPLPSSLENEQTKLPVPKSVKFSELQNGKFYEFVEPQSEE